MHILVIDNYDSFVYNLVQYLRQLGAQCDVRRHDEVTAAEVGTLRPAGVLLSPGPGDPSRAGICLEVVREYADEFPILGVCLGHQVVAEAFGGTVARAPELLHGKTSQVTHNGVGVLAGLDNPFTATRYHSLAVVEETLPDTLEVTARTLSPSNPVHDLLGLGDGEPADEVNRHVSSDGDSDHGLIMALRHRTLPVESVQFHPESVLTQGGHLMLANWLAQCGLPAALERAPALAAEVETRRLAAFAHP